MPREWPSEDSVAAMLERLSPCGRSVVLAFAFGARTRTKEQEAVALVVMHRMVFQTPYTERELSQYSGLSRNGVRSACRSFGALMRRCIGREGLRAASMFVPRADDPADGWAAEDEG